MKSEVGSRKSEVSCQGGAAARRRSSLSTFDFRLSTLAVIAVLAAGCGEQEAITAVPGDPKAGRAALERYQCGACHTIPGVAAARGLVGPPLTEYGQRVYIAGKFPQEPALLARWIQDAPSLAPQTAMPNVGVTEADARNMAAYLYQLR
jgi:cytochrome c